MKESEGAQSSRQAKGGRVRCEGVSALDRLGCLGSNECKITSGRVSFSTSRDGSAWYPHVALIGWCTWGHNVGAWKMGDEMHIVCEPQPTMTRRRGEPHGVLYCVALVLPHALPI